MENPIVIERLARIEEKLDGIIFRTVTTEAKTTLHEGRIRSLEVAQSRLMTGAAMIAFAVSSFLTYLHG